LGNSTKQFTVLIAPLDWGLGHATRIIPVVKFLQKNNCRVLIAASGLSGLLLQKTFPGVKYLESKSFSIRYSKKGSGMPWILMAQLPGIAAGILKEHFWLKKVCRKESVDLILSDNRPGLFRRGTTSVYMTHQLAIQSGNRFTDRLLQKINYSFINRYTACWVPDNEQPFSLAGNLSHPLQLPAIPTKYIGCLSRFEKTSPSGSPMIDLLVLLSGPEPQRTLFEELVLRQLEASTLRICLVRGVHPDTPPPVNLPQHVDAHNFMPAESLNEKILSAKQVLCRSGYSSVMDLVHLKKNAILIPTPGQTEQEYLAQYLLEKGYFYTVTQDHFNLPQALIVAAGFKAEIPEAAMDGFEAHLTRLIRP
jgi:hypothetical protein